MGGRCQSLYTAMVELVGFYHVVVVPDHNQSTVCGLPTDRVRKVRTQGARAEELAPVRPYDGVRGAVCYSERV